MENVLEKCSKKFHVPHGGIKEIAEKSGLSVYTVANVIRGKSKNKKVLLTIKNYLSDFKDLQIEVAQLSNEL